MDRKKIKEETKKIIEGNIWTLIKPYLIYLGINLAVGLLMLALGVPEDSWQESVITLIAGFAMMPLVVGIYSYYLKFVRKEEYKISNIFEFNKHIFSIVLIQLVCTIMIYFGFILLLIPGIILSLSLSMVCFLMADGKFGLKDTIKTSMLMMKGYKGDFFVFNLSFIGWMLLGVITFGLAYIYVIPYINVATVLYYEELKKKQLAV